MLAGRAGHAVPAPSHVVVSPVSLLPLVCVLGYQGAHKLLRPDLKSQSVPANLLKSRVIRLRFLYPGFLGHACDAFSLPRKAASQIRRLRREQSLLTLIQHTRVSSLVCSLISLCVGGLFSCRQVPLSALPSRTRHLADVFPVSQHGN